MISVNLGYIYNVISKQITGIIATNKDYFIYYADNEELNDYLHIIYYKQINGLTYKTSNINIATDKVTVKDKSFLHGLSYILPFPYHIQKLICKQISNVNDLYKIFSDLRLKELAQKNYDTEPTISIN